MESGTDTAGHRRFIVNMFSNLGNFGVAIFVGIWFTPYLVKHLGVAVYGMIPLATMVTSYLSLVTLALNSAVGRFIIIASEQGDVPRANRYFNTSLFGSIALAVLLVGPGLILLQHVDWVFHVPAGYELEARWLFRATLFVFLLATISAPFEVTSYCRNRFDLRNLVATIGLLIKPGVAILLFTIYAPRLWHVGMGMVISAIATFIGSLWIWRMLMPELRIRSRDFDVSVVRSLSSVGAWVATNQVGQILLLNIDLIVVNKMMGAYAGGRYAAVMQWSNLLRSLSGVIAGVFGPTIMYYYARKDISGLVDYTRGAVKFLGLLMALPIGLVCGLSRPLLAVWLGPKFVSLAPLMSLATIHLSVNLSIFPLFTIHLATNRVRWPGIVTCIIGLCNLGLAILLAGPVGWGMYGVAAAGAIVLTAKNVVFIPLYTARVVGRGHGTFYPELVRIVCVTTTLTGICWWLSRIMNPTGWHGLISCGLIVSCMYLAIVYRFLLSQDERKMALKLLRRFQTQ
jgi:membrane protein EpsK